jgi:GR25 family glycosyltransferase involved in LPS biosynthesis
MKKFVINLKQRPERLNAFFANCPFPRDEVEVVYGFDGQHPCEEDPREQELFHQNFVFINPGIRGCFLAHLRIYREIVDKGFDYAFIMEDDAIFCDHFLEKFHQVVREIPNDASLVYIGGRFQENFLMKSCYAIPATEHIVQTKFISWKRWNGVNQDRTTHAYIISNACAKKLLKAFLKNKPVDQAIDFWIIPTLIKTRTKIYNAKPLLCHSQKDGPSDCKWSQFKKS